jgi:aspartate kinase
MIVQAGTASPTADLTFTVTREDRQTALDTIAGLEGGQDWDVICDDDVAKVSIVGAGMMTNPGVAAKMFEALSAEEIPVFVVSTSEIKVSCLVPRSRHQDAVRVCHKKFELHAGK